MASRDRIRRIIITGAAGRIGTLLTAHFHSRGGYELVLIDRDPRGNEAIHKADLGRYDPGWTELFARADAVLHLAGEANPAAPWAPQAADNLEPSLNVFRAATENGVRRVVYASSLQVMFGYHYTSHAIAADAQPRPVSFYGAAKLFCEMMLRQFTEDGKFSAICLRIGWLEAGHELVNPRAGMWARYKWLSEQDLCQAFEKAILAQDVDFAILPLVSDNYAMPWDLSETRRTIGYTPSKGCPRHTLAIRLRIRAVLGRLYRRYIDPRWRDYWD